MTFIVAECGSNWLTFQDCLDSIKSAKECGADAVKFQMYTHKELYGYDGEMAGELPRAWITQLAKACEHYGIEFMCTAFSPDGYRYIDPYVKRHKIASAENTDKDILETVNGLGKPVIVSTGGTHPEYSEYFKTLVEQLNGVDTTLLFCVGAYPAKNVNFANLVDLAKAFRSVKVGYSCHTNEWITPFYAHFCLQSSTGKYLAVVEKHFMVRRMYTPDSEHSILPDEFKKMVHTLKTGSLSADNGNPQEEDMVKYHKRRFIPELGGFFRTKKPE